MNFRNWINQLRKIRFFKYETIYDPNNNEPYLKRFRIIETPWFGLFIHRILKDDWDRDLHDHPWNFTSVILKGSYEEECVNGTTALIPDDRLTYIGRQIRDFLIRNPYKRIFKAGSVIRHAAEDFHRITILKPVTTLFITGRKRKDWGFLTNEGWVHNQKYERAGRVSK